MPDVQATSPEKVADEGDKSLPDPTTAAKCVLAGVLAAAVGLAIIANTAKWTGTPFRPAKEGSAEFALFAGFYVVAQVIERLMELVTSFLPWPRWKPPTALLADLSSEATKTVTASYLKADRATVALGVATIGRSLTPPGQPKTLLPRTVCVIYLFAEVVEAESQRENGSRSIDGSTAYPNAQETSGAS